MKSTHPGDILTGIAVDAGVVRDKSYDTVRNGFVSSFVKLTDDTIEHKDGIFSVVASEPKGDAWSIWEQGGIGFCPVNDAAKLLVEEWTKKWKGFRPGLFLS